MWNSKVIWSEGMLLQPQHLQQHDRYLQTQLEARVAALRPYSWGFSELEIDQQQLALGKLALLSYSAVLPDGTPVGAPVEYDLPLPLDIPAEARNVTVMLALPSRRRGVPEVMHGAGEERYARHASAEYESLDSNGIDSSALMSVGRLRLRLALESEVADAYTTLGVAHVIERQPDDRVVLDTAYCPPSLALRAAPALRAFVDELLGLMRQRGVALASRLVQAGDGGVSEVSDFLMLQLLNRGQALVGHLAGLSALHPEALYRELLQLAGELATFSSADKCAGLYPAYRHTALRETFGPVIADLRRALSAVFDARAVSLPFHERQFGIRVAVLSDHELLQSANFVLAVQAQMPAEALRTNFPRQAKLSSVERIRDLVNLQLPGITLVPLPVAPRQLPFHAGYVYFELDRGSDYWRQLRTSAGIALHVGGVFPGLKLEFWAIRQDGTLA